MRTRPAILAALLVGISGLGSGPGCSKRVPEAQTSATLDVASQADVEALQAEYRSKRSLDPASIDKLKALIDRHPQAVAPRELLQAVYVQKEDWDSLERLVLSKPGVERSASDVMNLARIQIRQGRYAEAANLLQPLASADTSNADLARLAGHALFYSGRHAEAEPALRRATRRIAGPQAAEPLTLLGLVRFYAGDSDGARAALQQALTVDPEYRAALNAMGRVLAARGDDAGARRYFERESHLQARDTEDERRRMTLVAHAQDLQAARAAGRWAEAEAIVRSMLPLADRPLQAQLLRVLAEVQSAAGKPVESRATAARADSLARGGS